MAPSRACPGHRVSSPLTLIACGACGGARLYALLRHALPREPAGANAAICRPAVGVSG